MANDDASLVFRRAVTWSSRLERCVDFVPGLEDGENSLDEYVADDPLRLADFFDTPADVSSPL